MMAEKCLLPTVRRLYGLPKQEFRPALKDVKMSSGRHTPTLIDYWRIASIKGKKLGMQSTPT
jgi:hypothetical protein